ncbi:MAG: hypothetical protein ACI4F3_07400 [Enterocloster sp.]
MTGESMRSRVNIGAASLILIFIVLCLSTFSLLALSSARGDLSLEMRSGEAVRAYYRADSEGQRWLSQTDAVLREEMERNRDESLCSRRIKERLGDAYDEEAGLISADILMDRGMALHIDLALVWGRERYEIRSWYVYDREAYEIDSSMQVWDGNTSLQEQEE